MKKQIMCAVLALCMVAMLACGCARSKVINGKTYEPVGMFDQDERSPKIHYKVSVGNVVWSVLLIETVVVPIVLIGWYIQNPVCTVEEFEAR